MGMCELDLAVGVFFSSGLAIRIFGTCEKNFRGHAFLRTPYLSLRKVWCACAVWGTKKWWKGFSVLRGRKDCDLSRWF